MSPPLRFSGGLCFSLAAAASLPSACGGSSRSCAETETCPHPGAAGAAGAASTAGAGQGGGSGKGGGAAGGSGRAAGRAGSAGDGDGGELGTTGGAAGEGNGGASGIAGNGATAGKSGNAGSTAEGGMGGDGPSCPPGCSEECPCDAGEGPCSGDVECAATLVCGAGTGPKFGITGDACVPEHCTNDVTDGGETSQDCGAGCGCPVLEILSDAPSCAFAVSADGSYVAGTEETPDTISATRWLTRSQRVYLARLMPNDFGDAAAWAIDATGATLAGFTTLEATPFEYHVARWSGPSLDVTDLGSLPSGTTPTGAAHAISADGSVIVGRSGEGINSDHQAFRWTQAAGYTLLGFVDGGAGSGLDYSSAEAVSADGQVIVGTATDSTAFTVPFRWTEADGVQGLGPLSGGSPGGGANALNGNGTVIVGTSEGPNGSEAFLWQAGDMIGLGDLPGGSFSSSAEGVSDDGRRVVGTGSPPGASTEAFFWDEGRGMRTLHELMAERGLEQPFSEWSFESANAISADGKVVVGCASGPLAPDVRVQAYRLRLEP